jgi:DNA-binding transcriptional ArsR family regulator
MPSDRDVFSIFAALADPQRARMLRLELLELGRVGSKLLVDGQVQLVARSEFALAFVELLR